MGETLIKQTTTRCGTCGIDLPGRVVEDGGRVYLERMCPEHGFARVCISGDSRFYFDSRGAGCGEDCGCHVDNPFETLSTCLALIEIVNSCNMACPTCFADSPVAKESGGEPTLHPEFFELLAWAQAHPKIDYVLINTNGLRIANEAEFAAKLDAVYEPGKLQLYLQYDGPEAKGQAELRGADYRRIKTRAIERLAEFKNGGLPVTLAMTVIPENLSQLWATVDFGLEFGHVGGVAFQPAFTSGRATAETHPLNTADVIMNLVAQSRGVIDFDAFTPLPCGDPNCATIGYLLKTADGIRSMGEFIDYGEVQGFLQNRVNYNMQDLAQCGCDSEPLGDLLKQFELDESHTFRLFIKPFMDNHTWDQDRIDRCCTHVIRPDGELDSFCRYYAKAAPVPVQSPVQALTANQGKYCGTDDCC